MKAQESTRNSGWGLPPGTPARIVHSFNALQPAAEQVAIRWEPGMTLADAAPRTPLPTVCILNGEPVLRADWDCAIQPGDLVVYQTLPQGGGGSDDTLRVVLQIVVVVVVAYFAPYYAATFGSYAWAAQAATVIIAGALINAALPYDAMGRDALPGGSPTYSFGAQGNQVRIDQPLPVVYGTMLTFPDFACQPYSIYADNIQYWHAVYCVSQGKISIAQTRIDDTDITSYRDVEFVYVGPAQNSTLADQALIKTNMVTSLEVGGQEIEAGVYTGPFAACAARRKITRIGIDVILPRGLYTAKSGKMKNQTINWDVEAREINDADTPVGAWELIAVAQHTAKSATPQRLSYEYVMPRSARWQVRVMRTDTKVDSSLVANDIVWAGLRAELEGAGIDNETATYLCVRVRASEQLNGNSQRRFNVIARRILPVWDGGEWVDKFTRNPAWALADIWRNTVYGRALADDRIDIDTLGRLANVWANRQDNFDYVFSQLTTVDEATALVARAGRAVPLQRGGVWTVVRDGAQTIPASMYTQRSISAGSLELEYVMPTDDSADAIELEYWDGRAWDWRAVEAMAPGVTTPQRTVRQRLEGVIGYHHAMREAAYLVAASVWRRTLVRWETELQGLIPAYGSLVLVGHDMPRWGQAGDVVARSGSTLTLSESVDLTGGGAYIRLLRPSGAVEPPIAISAGAGSNQVVLGSNPDFELVTDSAHAERTKYLIGTSGSEVAQVILTGIRPAGDGRIQMSGALYAEEVHDADAEWLPESSAIQDPVGPA